MKASISSRLTVAVVLLGVFCLLGSQAASTPSRGQGRGPGPVGYRDTLSFKSVNGILSPDGKTVLFIVQRVDLEKNETYSSAWVVPFKGGEPVQLTRESVGDRMFQWSPDGRLVTFLGQRGSEKGVFVMRPDGGEPWNLFSHEQGILQYGWSPNSLRIAFIAPDKIPADEELAGKEKRDVIIEGGNHRMNHVWVYDLKADKTCYLTAGEEFSVLSLAWSPDARWIAFGAVPTPNATDYIRSEIYRVPVEADFQTAQGGQPAPGVPIKLTVNLGEDLAPQYTPDGRWIVYRSRPEGDLVSGYRIMRIPSSGGMTEDISPLADLSVGPYSFTGEVTAAFFSGIHGVETDLYRMSLDDRRPVRLTQGKGVWQDPSFSADLKRGVATFQDPLHPQELFALTVPDGGVRRLTDINTTYLSRFELAITETMTWRGADGWPIEGLLIHPLGDGVVPGVAHPLIVDIHGGPAGLYRLDFDPAAQYFAGLGYFIFRPNFRGSAGRGDAFRRADIGDWGGADFRDISAGVKTVLDRGDVDPTRIGIMGWSYGGFMTAWAATQGPLFKAAVVGAGMVDHLLMWGTQDSPAHYAAYFGGDPFERDLGTLYRDRSPLRFVKNIRAPVLILHGEDDKRVPASQALLFYNALKAVGAKAELVWYPRTGHAPQEPALRLDIVQRQAAWFSRYLLGKEMTIWPRSGPAQTTPASASDR